VEVVDAARDYFPWIQRYQVTRFPYGFPAFALDKPIHAGARHAGLERETGSLRSHAAGMFHSGWWLLPAASALPMSCAFQTSTRLAIVLNIAI
jgi:hypothetical protein